MKLGFNTYSFRRELITGETDILTVLERIAALGGEHAEIVPDTPDFSNGWTATPAIAKKIVARAKKLRLELSSYTIGANFVTGDNGEGSISAKAFKAEIARVKKEVEIAAALGCRFMRHDVCGRPAEMTGIAQFEKDLPRAVEACGIIADYAKPYGITTSIENHGLHFQASERVARLVLAVGRDNFRTTLDVGNFVCVDENPVVAVRNNIGIASMIHVKDMYVRTRVANPDAWAKTPHGLYRRPAVPGCGDIDLFAVADIILQAGYDGYISLEYEGREPLDPGLALGFGALQKLFRR